MLAVDIDFRDVIFSTEFIMDTDTAAKIISFEKLPPGWNYGEGSSIGPVITINFFNILASLAEWLC